MTLNSRHLVFISTVTILALALRIDVLYGSPANILIAPKPTLPTSSVSKIRYREAVRRSRMSQYGGWHRGTWPLSPSAVASPQTLPGQPHTWSLVLAHESRSTPRTSVPLCCHSETPRPHVCPRISRVS